ncbi:sulfurtransferase [Amycolatopsis cihanbeyliensis]
MFADLDTDLAAPPGAGGRHPLPDMADFEAAMRGLGVCEGHPVVCYDQRDSIVAARLWWMLRYCGHVDVRVLDGGYEAWMRAGLPVRTGDEEAARPGDFRAEPGALPVVTAEEAAAIARGGFLLDARAGERYRGELEPIDPVAGHIPGAVSAPSIDNVDTEGYFRSAERLRERFAALGIDQEAEVATYCGSGVTAAHEVLALHMAGFRAGLYAGSWSDWIQDPAREIATGG